MPIGVHETMQLGDLIVAAFDDTARLCTDSRDVPRVATRVVTQLLRGVGRASPPCPLPNQERK